MIAIIEPENNGLQSNQMIAIIISVSAMEIKNNAKIEIYSTKVSRNGI